MRRKGKSPCPMAVGTEAKHNYQSHYSRKRRLSKAQRAIVADLLGAILVFATMVLITMLLLLVGLEVGVC